MTLDATVAGASSDSYLTVAAADTLAGNDMGPEPAGWALAITADKEKALKRATREIDALLRSGWGRYSNSQALLFPRTVDVASSAAYIPIQIQRACYQQAIFLIANATALAGAAARRALNLQSGSEPNVSWSEAGSATDDGTTAMSPLAMLQLAGFRLAGQPKRVGTVRSLRVQSGFRGW